MQATLHIETGERAGESVRLAPGETKVIGSGPDAGLRLADAGVAAQHAAVVSTPAGVQAVDLGGGCALNGKPLPLRQPVDVASEDELSVGPVAIRIEVVGAPRETAAAVAQRTAGPPLPPEQFELIGELGRGAMGVVYLARRRADGVPVAVKRMLESVPEGSSAHRRFVVEAQVGARVQSPYVVRVLDARVQGDAAFIVMEYVDGPSAKQQLRAGRIGAADALRIGEHVARALAAAAQAGVVHRDVKPENVLLSPDGIAKLSDFGIAKDLETSMRSLTQSGTGLGTLAYIAPEAIHHAKHVDTAADLYGLGATLFTLLTGAPPFDIRKPEELGRVLRDPPPPLTAALPACPLDLSQLVARLLAKNPYDRPPRADAVADELAAIARRELG